MNKDIRVRIAPSPTGFFHLGTARSALFNWIFARQHNGKFIIRIEDTDKERSEEKYSKDLINGLASLGLTSDEDIQYQSSLKDKHASYLKKLLEEDKIFYCEHTIEELEEESKQQRDAKEAPRHVCEYRNKKLTKGIIRFKNDSQETLVVHDIVRGDVSFEAPLLGDFSIARNIDDPLHNFAVAVDDADMKISHVIRGEDLLSNTPKQILILKALGMPEPEWAHLPLLLNPDKSKLSKRKGAIAINDLLDTLGYLPEALINFIALLGWHPKDEVGEVLNYKILIKEFSLDRVQKGGAVVSFEKLDWLNKEHIKKLSEKEYLGRITSRGFITPLVKEVFKNYPEEAVNKAALSVKSRITKFSELENFLREIVEPLGIYEKELLLWKGKLEIKDAKEIIDRIIKILSDVDIFTQSGVEAALHVVIEKHGKGSILWPLRVALSGKEVSIGPYELAEILGKNESMDRLNRAREILNS